MGAGQPFVFIFVAVILLTGLFSNCFSLDMECYVCNSAFNPDCGDSPVPEKYLVPCTPQTASPLEPSSNRDHTSQREVTTFSVPKNTVFTFCRKNVVTIPQQINGNETKSAETRLIRSCGFLQKDNEPNCKWAANHGISNYICQCDRPACNSATVTSWTWSVFISCVVVVRMIF